jgi:hypothetical protein
MQKNSMPQLSEVIRGIKTKIYCQGTICQRCNLLAIRAVGLGLTKVGNQGKPLERERKKNSYQFRVDVQPLTSMHSQQQSSRD